MYICIYNNNNNNNGARFRSAQVRAYDDGA